MVRNKTKEQIRELVKKSPLPLDGIIKENEKLKRKIQCSECLCDSPSACIRCKEDYKKIKEQ
jgi:hypothetical protein